MKNTPKTPTLQKAKFTLRGVKLTILLLVAMLTSIAAWATDASKTYTTTTASTIAANIPDESEPPTDHWSDYKAESFSQATAQSITIANANELALFAYNVNQGTSYQNINITLADDIDLSAHIWTPIGTGSGKPFKGIFDGDGHTISGMYINTNSNYQGLFGYITGGVVKNLSIAASQITVGSFAGAVAGYNRSSQIEGCVVAQDVTITAGDNNNSYIGGITGYISSGTVNACVSGATVTKGDYNNCKQLGGIAGYNVGTISNCLYIGTEVTGNSYSGRIVGQQDNSGTLLNNLHHYASDMWGGGVGDNREYGNDKKGKATKASSILPVDGIKIEPAGTPKASIAAFGISAYDNSILYNGTIYAYTQVELQIYIKSATAGYKATSPTASSGTLTDNNDGTYTISGYDDNTVISATLEETDLKIDDAAISGVQQQYSGGSPIEISPVVTFNETVLTLGIHYSIAITYNGQQVDAPSAPGIYTLTVSGIGEYGGSQSLSFRVLPSDNWTDDGNRATSFSDIENSVIKIHNAAELALLAYNINTNTSTYANYTIELADNIDLSQHYWIPISMLAGATLDGKGHSIHGLTIAATATNDGKLHGLVGQLYAATIKNLTISSSSITGNKFVGAIVGNVTSNGTITNCYVGKDVYIYAAANGAEYIGGIAGYNSATIKGCKSEAIISHNEYSNVQYCGGIAGYNDQIGEITECYVSKTTADDAAAIAGDSRGSISQCFYNAANDPSADRLWKITFCDGTRPNGTGNEYDVAGITFYTNCIKIGDIFYSSKIKKIYLLCDAPEGITTEGYTVHYTAKTSTQTNVIFANEATTLLFYMSDGDVEIHATWKKRLTHTDITIAEIPDQPWTGEAITPAITILDGSTDITSECAIAYDDNRNTGTATATITAKAGSEGYSGSRTVQFAIIDKKTSYGALTIIENQDGKIAELDENYSGTEGITITNDIDDIKYVTLNRTFTPSVYSTIILPFDAKVDASDGAFYQFEKVTPPEGNSLKWVAHYAEVTKAEANKPYIFIAKVKEPTFYFDDEDNQTIKKATTSLSSPGKVEEGESESQWTFTGVYAKETWSKRTENIYGFAGAKKEDKEIAIGDFVRAGKNSSVRPFRCYLTYDGVWSKSTSSLPDRIEVRITSATVAPDGPADNPDIGDITTPTSELAPVASNVNVWSSDHTIYIAAAPGTPYRIIDATGRVLKDAATLTDRDEIRLGNRSGIAIVVVNNKTFKIQY